MSLSLFVTACSTTNQGCVDILKSIFMPALMAISRRTVWHEGFQREEGANIFMDAELEGRQPLSNTQENRTNSVEHRVQFVVGMYILL